MNEARRKEINKAIALLQEGQAKIQEALTVLETIKDEEREYYDNMPESLQSGDKGEKADQAANNLEEVHSTLEELDIDDLVSKLEEAAE